MHVRSAAVCAAVSVGGSTVVEIVWPPVLTVPLSWSALRESAPTAEVTPGILATSLIATDGKVMSVPGTKKSWVNCVPGLPSFARSVMIEELLFGQRGGPRAVGAVEAPDATSEESPSAGRKGVRAACRESASRGERAAASAGREGRRRGGLRRRRRDGARHDDVSSD